ncbi:MAG: TraR/DksA family transcriptional regulator [Austwickia sp.]|nr:TraR/DksA family transcriptional regulator [Actinomycetota bacterium]MCB1253392.1 TraR/DksA family transcriptional regulator [Austwickia sp.]MCO5310523.1 TraR/DksA family transcriptional regulator [Austwickia sp.]
MPGTPQPAADAQQADVSWLPLRDGEEPWTGSDLQEITLELLDEKKRLEEDLAESEMDLQDLMRDYGGGSGDDSADTGGKVLEREQELTLTNNSRTLLAQTERALERLADHTYGACENCGLPIGKLRLQAFPRATLCVSCKQKQERR